MKPCLGGWCPPRSKCAHHELGTGARDDVRLCAQGQELPAPIKVSEAQRAHEAEQRQRERQEMYEQLTDHEMGRITLNDSDLKAFRAAVRVPA